jgi:4-hydroxy-tetrahydrodipicolinate synthase
MNWYGVMPAMTTCFDADLRVDHAFLTRHARSLLEKGCTGIVSLGSLGEAATLAFEEKAVILKTMVAAADGRAPIIAAISALSTSEAVELAKTAADAGCSGLMVLPPYVYRGDWRETKAHMAAIFSATPLSCMLYNNPVAYGTDFLPEQIHELAAEHPNLHAIKESSTDVRRVTAIRAIDDARLRIFVGVDDAILEGIAAGATGWIAGLVNAFPAESVALFDYAMQGHTRDAF